MQLWYAALHYLRICRYEIDKILHTIQRIALFKTPGASSLGGDESSRVWLSALSQAISLRCIFFSHVTLQRKRVRIRKQRTSGFDLLVHRRSVQLLGGCVATGLRLLVADEPTGALLWQTMVPRDSGQPARVTAAAAGAVPVAPAAVQADREEDDSDLFASPPGLW